MGARGRPGYRWKALGELSRRPHEGRAGHERTARKLGPENLRSPRGGATPGSGRPFSAPATMPPEAQQPPGPATEPAPAATRHLPSPWIPWPPSSPPHWLILRPSPAAAFQLLLLHGRRAHSPLLPAPPPRHRGIDPHPSCSCRRRQPSIQWFGASQHAAMAASRRRSTSAGNGCLPMQLYDERRKPAPGLAFRGAIGASDGQSGGFICVPRNASSGGC